MLHEGSQCGAGIGMILTELRTAVVVCECPHIVDTRKVTLSAETADDGVCLTVDTTDGGYNPQFVADTHITVGTKITAHNRCGRSCQFRAINRGILILEVITEAGGKVM